MSAGDPTQVHELLTVDEVVSRWPMAAEVFVRRRMHCIGCEVARFETIADACRIYRQPVHAVVGELKRTIEAGPRRPRPGGSRRDRRGGRRRASGRRGG